jgi:ketosteroid isomerase-like protein
VDLQGVIDELEIRRLIDVYCDGVNRKHAPTWASVWAEDGSTWQLTGPEIVGKQEICSYWEQAVTRYPKLFQGAVNGIIDLDGDQATGVWYIIEKGQRESGAPHEMVATYRDRYVRTADGWRIQRRELQILPMTE